MAHQGQELRAHAVDLVERREVLQGRHHRAGAAIGGRDRRDVHQRAHAPAVRHRQHNLLRAHGFVVREPFSHRELGQRQFAAVRAPAGDHIRQLLGRVSGRAQALDDAPRLAVEREYLAAGGVEAHDPHGRGLDQSLEIGPGAALGAVSAGVGHRGGSLGCEYRQHRLVCVVEIVTIGLLCEEEDAGVYAAVAHRGALEGPHERRRGLHAEVADVAREVARPQRSRQLAQVVEEPHAVRPGDEPLLLVGLEAGEVVADGLARLVDDGDHPEARAGKDTGALDHLAQQRVKVEGGGDPEDGGAKGGGGDRAGRGGIGGVGCRAQTVVLVGGRLPVIPCGSCGTGSGRWGHCTAPSGRKENEKSTKQDATRTHDGAASFYDPQWSNSGTSTCAARVGSIGQFGEPDGGGARRGAACADIGATLATGFQRFCWPVSPRALSRPTGTADRARPAERKPCHSSTTPTST